MKKRIWLALGCLIAFVLWTICVQCIDVQTIGPKHSAVGFAGINGAVHRWTGVHMELYTVTDWLGLVPLATALGFGVLGLVQWIKRKSIKKVDGSILVLGGFYLVTMGVYLLFEQVVINYRPVLIEGNLEVSYPSSTTLLVLCVMPTTILQLRSRVCMPWLRRGMTVAISAFIGFMVGGRFLSGVHWLTDIIGGILLSTGLVLLYKTIVERIEK